MRSTDTSSAARGGRLLLLAAALLTALGLALAWGGIAAADTPAPTPTATPGGDTAAPADGNPFPITDTMTDTMQLVLDAYLAANADPGLASASGPVEIADTPRSIAFLPLVVRGATGPAPAPEPIATPRPTATPRPDRDGADIAVTLWPDPSIRAARGGIVAYAIRVTNHGDGKADRIEVALPFNRQHLSLANATLDASKGDWVSGTSDTRVDLTFGPLDEGATRTGTVFFRINGALATDTVLDMRARFSWSDARGGHDGAGSNWAPVLVGGGNDSAPWVWLKVDPTSGTASVTRAITSNRYAPYEGVVTWLNTPQGVKPFDLRGTADALGNVSLRFTAGGLARGTYQIVVYGTRSALTGVATFTVQ